MRFEHCGVEHLLVADTSLFQDFRFQIKADEIFGLFTLNNHLRPLFEYGDGQFFFLGEKQGVGSIGKFESSILQKISECFRLEGRMDIV